MRRFMLLADVILSSMWQLGFVIWYIALRRAFEDYVYVNKDGTARELSPDERPSLRKNSFQPMVPGRT